MNRSTGNSEQAIRALRAASNQIELALNQSQLPLDTLAETLRRLASLLADPAQAARPDALAIMRAELLRGITCLQFHDRMTQHLQHVRDYLSGSADHMAQHDAGEEAWSGLHNRLHDRLLSETQRMHLGPDFLLGALRREQKQHEGTAASRPGDIDLF